MKMLQTLSKLVELNRKSIEQFINVQSNQVDSYIINSQRSENLEFLLLVMLY